MPEKRWKERELLFVGEIIRGLDSRSGSSPILSRNSIGRSQLKMEFLWQSFPCASVSLSFLQLWVGPLDRLVEKSTPKSAEIRAQSESPSLIKPRANCQALKEEHEDENESPPPPEHISEE